VLNIQTSYSNVTADGRQDSGSINAFSFVRDLQYFLYIPRHPRVGIQYAPCSGDRDRNSVNHTIGGHTPGTKDRNPYIPDT